MEDTWEPNKEDLDRYYLFIFNKYKTFSALIYSYINTSGIGRTRNCMETRRPKVPEGWSVFIQFRIFPTSTSVNILYISIRKKVLYLFYNIVMSNARMIRKISVFTSAWREFSVFTLSYVSTALKQSAFRIHKCYIIKIYTAISIKVVLPKS